MNKFKKHLIAATFFGALLTPAVANAQFSLSDAFNSSTLGNIVEGVFSSSDITLKDIVGEYAADGPAVCFKGDNFLKNAGGVAAAGVIESKLAPYYAKYGLDKMKLTIDANGKFIMYINKIQLKGTVVETKTKGTFQFRFEAFDKIKLGTMTAYIQKSYNSMDVMFDASKVKNALSKMSSLVPSNTIKSVGSILDSYDGLCIGSKLIQTNAPASNNSNRQESSSDNQLNNAIKGLFNTLSKKK